jgi:hypothetical protein
MGKQRPIMDTILFREALNYKEKYDEAALEEK